MDKFYKTLQLTLLAFISLYLGACATYDKEGVKVKKYWSNWSVSDDHLADFKANAKSIYDTANTGYALVARLTVNRVVGKEYSESVGSQALAKAKTLNADLITKASSARKKGAYDVKKGIECEQVTSVLQKCRHTSSLGDKYYYYSTDYYVWANRPDLAIATIFPAAASLGYNKTLKKYLKMGVNPYTTFSKRYEYSPHALAIYSGKTETLDLLLSYQSGVEEILYKILAFAIKHGRLSSVKSLVNKGLDINKKIGYSEWTPIMYAANYGRKDIVLYLLNKGANPDLYGRYSYAGETNHALHIAKRKKHPEIVKILEKAIAKQEKKKSSQ